MNKVHAHKVGLVFGALFGIGHTVWSLLVLVGIAKPYLDWILALHFLNLEYSIDAFSFSNAFMLIVITTCVGYVIGTIVGWLWNMAHRASHNK